MNPLVLGYVAGTTGLGLGAVGVVLGDAGDALEVREATTAWVLALFSLGLGVGTTLGGRLADVAGPRRVLGLSVFSCVVGCALCAAAPSFAVLAAGRLLVGAAAGGLSLVAFGVAAAAPEALRARAGGTLTAVSTLIIGSGPLIGAAAAEAGGWRATMALPALALLGVPALLTHLPRQAHADVGLDLRGALLVTLGGTAVAALLQAPATDLSGLAVAGLALLAATGAGLLAVHVRRRPAGFLPLEVLRNRRLMLLSAAAGTLLGAYAGVLFAAPLLLERERGWGALETGLALLPAAGAAAAAALAAGRLAAGRPADRVVASLCVLSAAGLLIGALGGGAAGTTIAAAILTVAGFAACQAVMLDRVPALVSPATAGIALGTFNFLFISGAAIGSAAIGGASAALGLAGAVAVLALLPLAGAVAALTACETRPALATRPSASRG